MLPSRRAISARGTTSCRPQTCAASSSILSPSTRSGTHGKRGHWPDALVPLARPFAVKPECEGNWNQPLWIDIQVPRDQPPGDYRGRLFVSCDRADIGAIEIALTVHDLALPAERHFPSLVGLWNTTWPACTM